MIDSHGYPPISDYGLVGDCHSSALVSRQGSIDWCCMPRFDSPSVFGRLLDWEKGGHCSITPTDRQFETSRRYVDRTLVLETVFRSGEGEVRLLDCMVMREGGRQHPRRQLLRTIEGVKGSVELEIGIVPRLEYGAVKPWISSYPDGVFTALGGHTGLVVSGTIPLIIGPDHDLTGVLRVDQRESYVLSIEFARPETVDEGPGDVADRKELQRRIEETVAWWERWSDKIDRQASDSEIRSAIVLKALSNAPTGAFVAAPTTSLPEAVGGERNWDYRYSWVRDSVFSVEALADLGCEAEAEGFRRFIERSAAGSAAELQLMYGVGGETRLDEVHLDDLEGYRQSRPVRVGNSAYRQTQLDVYGYLVDLAWSWQLRGRTPSNHYWEFLVDLVDTVCARWEEPDKGIWEIRGEPEHFVHSKVMCWAAVDRGIRLAEAAAKTDPVERWRTVREDIRAAIERRGYDTERGIFVRSFESEALDAALLLLPVFGFVRWDDPRMMRTASAIHTELGAGHLVRRYLTGDGLEGSEGAFLACSFWLARCYARQGRVEEAKEVFELTASTSNDLGLFSEEAELETGASLGNFPQALSHLAHLTAMRAIRDAGNRRP